MYVGLFETVGGKSNWSIKMDFTAIYFLLFLGVSFSQSIMKSQSESQDKPMMRRNKKYNCCCSEYCGDQSMREQECFQRTKYNH
jgi:hypothetical protein